MTSNVGGLPYDSMAVPGRDLGLELLLSRQPDGTGDLVVLPYRVTSTAADGTPNVERFDAIDLRAGEAKVPPGMDFSVGLARFSDYTLLIAKKDPGQGIVWTAFLALIIGLAITFYLPRRRIWARLAPTGEVALVARSDRYVDLDREFGRFLDDLVRRRAGGAATG
jgi:cytochrome c biogenesis protein ResB